MLPKRRPWSPPMNDFLKTQSALIVIAACALFVLTQNIACRKYGDVSPKAYDIAKALYSVCNRKDETALERVEQLIDEAAANSEISDDEQGHLLDIVTTARTGDWQTAMGDARTMMSDQITD